MKLNLDNKYHCQLPRAGETRRQRPLTRHRAHSRAPRDRGLHHLRDPAPTIGVFPAGVEPATQTGRFTSPGGGGSTQHSPGTKDVSPGSPRAGLLRTTQRSSHVPGEPQGGAPEDHISHPMSPGSPRAGLRGPQRSAMAWGPFQSRLWGGGGAWPRPGYPAATHWARLHTLLSCLPRLQTTWEEKEARDLARLLGRRRAA